MFNLELTYPCVVCYGIHGIRRYKRQNVGLFATVNLPYWGLIGVGTFSSLYHSTLKYHTQMCKSPSSHPVLLNKFPANSLDSIAFITSLINSYS